MTTLPPYRMNDIIITPEVTLSQAIENAVSDYICCHQLQPNTEAMCKAIMLAVDYG